MNILFDQILQHREAAALPSLSESGGLPALISGLGAVHRANLAAALRGRTARPLVVICPDDASAESFARDLSVMLEEEVVTLELRDFTFAESEAVSRGGEQKRLAALWKLLGGASAAVLSVAGALQRTIPPQLLQRAAFTIADGGELPMEDALDALVRKLLFQLRHLGLELAHVRHPRVAEDVVCRHARTVYHIFWDFALEIRGGRGYNNRSFFNNNPTRKKQVYGKEDHGRRQHRGRPDRVRM